MSSTVTQIKKRSARDYQFGNTIGEGSYSTVYSAIDIHNNKTYAIKVLSKRHIVKEDKIKYVNIEKTTLHRLGLQHPGIVQLYYTFQDDSSLFFVLDFAEYGELLSIIRKFGSLSEQVSLFYMCQLIDSVKFIHLKGIIHRDLKPENILVGIDFNLKITDFGAAKLLDSDQYTNDGDEIDYKSISDDVTKEKQERKASFVGTAEYVAPELLKHNSCGFESDIWALGCILYQFFNGNPPFKGQTEYLTFEKIINVEYSYKPSLPLPSDVVSIIDQILLADPGKRLTIPQIQGCNWFSSVQWNDPNYIWGRKVPRFEPYESNSSPFSPGIKTGYNRNVNKSSSQQKLHTQIHNSDFNLIPTVGAKKSYQPATKIKKFPMNVSPKAVNYSPPQGLAIQSMPPPPPQNIPPQVITTPTMVPQGMTTPNLNQQQLPPQQSPINNTQRNFYDKSGLPPSPSQIRKNTSFNNMGAMNGMNNVPKLQRKLSNPVSSPYYQQPSIIPKTNINNNFNMNHASAAAAAVGNLTINDKPVKPMPVAPAKVNPPQPKPVEKPKTPSPKIPPQPLINKIKFKEISSLLLENEKILKLDVIFKSELSKKLRPSTQSLNDGLIEKLIEKHESHLKANAKPVVTIITNMARVFFIDGSLNVMLIDLKANNGGDYLMYDYEFETVAVDSEEEEVEDQGEEVFGYLILELIREGGDLIFLKRISQDDLPVKDDVKVVDKNGKDVKLGVHYGWIDCLLIAKDMVAKASKTKSPPSPTLNNKPKKEPVAKKIRPKSAIKEKPDKKNFAYAAAAAAHK